MLKTRSEIQIYSILYLIKSAEYSGQIKTSLAYYSERFLGVKNRHRYSNQSILKFDLKNSSSQLSLNCSRQLIRRKYTTFMA